MNQTFNKLRFIAYAIPTIPKDAVIIGAQGSGPGPGAVAGTYLANPDNDKDMEARVRILKQAVDVARERIADVEDDDKVLNVFVAPEFYFHGIQGPYLYESDEDDPAERLRGVLSETFEQPEYRNWLFICGTVITAQIRDSEKMFAASPTKARNKVVKSLCEQWLATYGPMKEAIADALANFVQTCHAYPCCKVRNRSIIVSQQPMALPQVNGPQTNYHSISTEKYYVSNEDFLLYDTSDEAGASIQGNYRPIVTEQMVAYDFIDLTQGDAKRSPFDKYAIFEQSLECSPPTRLEARYGVEICLDHRDTRLRRSIHNSRGSGEAAANEIGVQVIPSCGMQIISTSVAAKKGGIVFNCDGHYALGSSRAGSETISGVDCLFANYQDSRDSVYAAHSQLALVDEPARGSNPYESGSRNATFLQLGTGSVEAVEVPRAVDIDIDACFAGGPGEVHIYGLRQPFEVP